MPTSRLTRQKWIDAGLTALVSDGPQALAAEPMARRLGTTKGSFYWHFEHVADYHKSVLNTWQSKAVADVSLSDEDAGPPDKCLRRFGAQILADVHDPAIRTWAQSDEFASGVVADIDRLRLQRMTRLLAQLDITNPNFAQSTLAALIGLRLLPGVSDPDAAFETLIDLVLALR